MFNPFTKHDENEARHDHEDEDDSTEEEGSYREWVNNLFCENVMGMISRLNTNG